MACAAVVVVVAAAAVVVVVVVVVVVRALIATMVRVNQFREEAIQLEQKEVS